MGVEAIYAFNELNDDDESIYKRAHTKLPRFQQPVSEQFSLLDHDARLYNRLCTARAFFEAESHQYRVVLATMTLILGVVIARFCRRHDLIALFSESVMHLLELAQAHPPVVVLWAECELVLHYLAPVHFVPPNSRP